MTFPTPLAPPPVVAQEPARCWSAAFQSWHEAVSGRIGTAPAWETTDLHRMLEVQRGMETAEGRATDRGVRFLLGVGFMSQQRMRGMNVTIGHIGKVLSGGYIWCGYSGANFGHACVIYGVSEDGFMVMDPAVGRGLITYPPRFFTSADVVVLGSSLIQTLSDNLAQTLGGLRNAGGSSAGDIINQFN